MRKEGTGSLNDVVHASYPEINPELEYKNNKWQAAAMGVSLEKTLNKAGIMETYNAQFQDLINRDCIKLVSPQEIKEWEAIRGKVSYISHHPVLVPDKATMPCHLVINSSLRNSGSGPSPNDNWPKGPNTLKPMHGVFLGFRLYRVAIHFDLLKMFHTVRTREPKKFMCVDGLEKWQDRRHLAVLRLEGGRFW